ncbi:Dynein light chain 1, axonemal [Harpegnathos saltator]|uniref:Dynein axonemal light chain 1 n=1 Tax=Harpegnathos saltator TaxID=610380 RepID=E2BQS5_HARSA|nr:Dynein light chain 1, axonemal [Harpegnathos saltator]
MTVLCATGVVNRGDSFRRRRSRSNSLAPAEQENEVRRAPPKEVVSHNVAMLGSRGVGKTALISQFMTSECINAYDRQRGHVKLTKRAEFHEAQEGYHFSGEPWEDVPSEQSVFVMLNGEESELRFLNIANPKSELDKMPLPDAFVVMYSVIDKASFQRAEEYLARLHDQDLLRGRPAILVGNKVDLVRSRVVSPQDGKCLACTYRAKFVEVSVGINHNVDDLLVGILNQIRLKVVQGQLDNRNSGSGSEGSGHWYKSRGVVRASMKARQMLTWLFGKEDSKFKNCENLHVSFRCRVEKRRRCDPSMSTKPTTCKEAVRRWEEENEQEAAKATEVILSFQWPPVEKMDNALATLANCEKLSLSTNMIEKIAGRNLIKGFTGLEPLGDTLEELWISYNCIEKLKGVQAMRNLRVLYMSNNLVREWNELMRLQELPNIRDLLFVGNPLYENLEVEQWRSEVARRLPALEKLDGEPIIRTEENPVAMQMSKINNPSHDSLEQEHG